MATILPRIRKPVERDRGSRYVLYTLLSFAVSISLTRLFLELTGYPQLGGGNLHIAHVLWGGLLLFIAAVIPLMWVNRWALTLDAILAGAGAGLFMDEVGKFITSNNDYFYPPAAPIIYAFFLLTVLLYLELRRPHKRDIREGLYDVLEDLQEVLDQDLSPHEQQHILAQLQQIERSTNNKDFTRLINQLQQFITSDTLYMVPHQPDYMERLQQAYYRLEKRWVNKRGMQAGLAGALFAMGLWTLRYPILVILNVNNPSSMQQIIIGLVQTGLVKSSTSLFWFESRLGLQFAVGIILLIGASFLALKKDQRGIAFSYLGMLLSLTTVNLLMFYFDQFSTIVTAIVQFCLLMIIIYYRRRYLSSRLI